MFSSRIQGLIIVIVGGFLIIFGVTFFSETEGYNTANESVKEYVSTSMYTNRDDSARVSRREFYLNKTDFEKDVSKKIKARYGDSTKITYDYLHNDKSSNDESIKGVRVYIVTEKERYVTTNIIDFSNKSDDKNDDITDLQE